MKAELENPKRALLNFATSGVMIDAEKKHPTTGVLIQNRTPPGFGVME
jgi:hypothetical protein